MRRNWWSLPLRVMPVGWWWTATSSMSSISGALKAAGRKLLVVDDTGHAGVYAADLVLDQNAHATEKLYQCREPYSKLLLGSRYALLRREFRPWREWKREIAPVARKVLVTVGGTDPDNLTVRVMRALQIRRGKQT